MDNRIEFQYQPFDFDNRGHFVEKDEEGKKRRYLKGIVSGTRTDGHGERITDKCIKSFHEQANKGDLLLYADKHGIRFTDDIGILVKSVITPENDWYAEWRLYDESDGVGPNTLERCDKLWRQMLGLPPYKVPKQKGFSVEGYIPPNGIIAMSSDGRRVIDEVALDGAVVVPRPAYKTSIAHALYKALGENSPYLLEKEINSFKASLELDNLNNSYYKKRYQFQDKLEDMIENVMLNKSLRDKREALGRLFSEYGSAMTELIANSESIFDCEKSQEDMSGRANNNKIILIKSLISEVDTLIKSLA